MTNFTPHKLYSASASPLLVDPVTHLYGPECAVPAPVLSRSSADAVWYVAVSCQSCVVWCGMQPADTSAFVRSPEVTGQHFQLGNPNSAVTTHSSRWVCRDVYVVRSWVGSLQWTGVDLVKMTSCAAFEGWLSIRCVGTPPLSTVLASW